MHITRRLSYSNVISSVALFCAMSGGAYAAVQNGGINVGQAAQKTTVEACVNSFGGMTYTDTGVCPEGTALLSWSKQGPEGKKGDKGAAGVQGPKGDAGAQGPAGPSFVRGRMADKVQVGTSWTVVAKVVQVPKGLHRVSAKGYAEYFGELPLKASWSRHDCRLRNAANPGEPKTLDSSVTEVSDDGPEWATLSLEGLASVEVEGGTILFECKDDGGLAAGDATWIRKAKLNVQEVGGWYATNM